MTLVVPAPTPAVPAARPERAVVTLDAVSKVYRSRRTVVPALDAISLSIPRHSFTCVVGASGCGKSTLLNLLAGLDTPSAGALDVVGRTGLMFQESALFPWLTVAANVDLALRLRNVKRTERRDRVEELLELVHLSDFADRRPHELSGGMRQRVALARTLAQDADILLMDEPFGALDAMTRDVMHDELESIWHSTGTTIVFVTHNVREAARLADTIVLLSSRPGRVAQIFGVDLARPRRIEDRDVSELAAEVTAALRKEVSVMAVVDLHADVNGAALSGLDALETTEARESRAARTWASLWPKVAALLLALAIWQLVVWSGWKPSYTLPGPDTVLPRLWEELGEGATWRAIGVTMRRAAMGFSLAIVAGVVLGIAVSRVRVLRTAVGSMITGLQTMPSISWFPLALILFKQSEAAILFVVLIGAAPSIANGLIAGIDQIPPILLRAGRVLGATGVRRYRYVVMPAALPAFVAGLKQGWAFTWRSLMAGELLVIIANQPSIGSRLKFEQEFADSPGLISWMLIILIIGVVVDAVFFGSIERVIRERRGLGET